MSDVTSKRRVLLTAGAQQDLEALHAHLSRVAGSQAAEQMLEELLEVAAELVDFPERGAFPKELLALGIREYRQMLFRPWRLIYRIHGDDVVFHLIVDGRRDLRGLLARRLLEA